MSDETFGKALRRWREDRQLSVRALAAIAHCGKSQISDFENGVRKPRLDTATHLDNTLDAGGELVAIAEREQTMRTSHTRRAAPSPNQYADLATRLLTAGQGGTDDPMRRRAFVQGLGGLAGLGLAAPGLALEAARHGLVAGLVEQRVDATADEWHEIVTEYGYSYQTAAPAELLEALMIDVIGVQHALNQEHDDAALRELRRAGALPAALTAMTMANLGHLRHAERWWRSARRIADQSGDPHTVTWVRGREVVRALYEQRPLGMIWRLIDDADARAVDAPPAALPELVSGKAQAFALAGRADEATVALRKLQDVYAALPSESTADRATVLSWAEDRLRFTESFVYSYLGQIDEADVAQSRAIEVYPASYRRGPAQIELQRALCLTRTGDVAEGARHAQSVLVALPPADHIRPIFDLTTRVLDAVPIGHRDGAAVASLRDCFDSLQPSAELTRGAHDRVN